MFAISITFANKQVQGFAEKSFFRVKLFCIRTDFIYSGEESGHMGKKISRYFQNFFYLVFKFLFVCFFHYFFEGFEAIIDSRSSGPKKLGLFIPNGQGVVDNTYNGNNDQWHYVCSPMRETVIEAGDRICQFRIQLSQKATMWQKIKWLLSSGIELVEVDDLGDNNRGGFGTSGVK